MGLGSCPLCPLERCCEILTASGPRAQVRPAKGSPESPPKPAAGLAAGRAPDASPRGPGRGGRLGRCPTRCCGCTWLSPRPAAAAGGMRAGTRSESRDAIPKSRAAVLTAEFRFLATSCKLDPPGDFLPLSCSSPAPPTFSQVTALATPAPGAELS